MKIWMKNQHEFNFSFSQKSLWFLKLSQGSVDCSLETEQGWRWFSLSETDYGPSKLTAEGWGHHGCSTLHRRNPDSSWTKGLSRSPLQFFICPPGVLSAPAFADHLTIWVTWPPAPFVFCFFNLSFPSIFIGLWSKWVYYNVIINFCFLCVCVCLWAWCLCLPGHRWHHVVPVLWLADVCVRARRHSESHRAPADDDKDEGVGAAPRPLFRPLCLCWWWVSKSLINSVLMNLLKILVSKWTLSEVRNRRDEHAHTFITWSLNFTSWLLGHSLSKYELVHNTDTLPQSDKKNQKNTHF